jgi:hypothetical protein
MTEAEWLASGDAQRLLAYLESRGMVTDRKQRLFADALSDRLNDYPLRGEAVRTFTWIETEKQTVATILRDIFGNPFRPVAFDPMWRTDTAVSVAQQMYESRDFGAMPILADALQDAGCDNDDILNHCRGSGPHVRGCWVVDLVLRKV